MRDVVGAPFVVFLGFLLQFQSGEVGIEGVAGIFVGSIKAKEIGVGLAQFDPVLVKLDVSQAEAVVALIDGGAGAVVGGQDEFRGFKGLCRFEPVMHRKAQL